MCTGGERSSSAATGGRCRAGEALGWDVRFLVRYIGRGGLMLRWQNRVKLGWAIPFAPTHARL